MRVQWDRRCAAIPTTIRRLGPVISGRLLSSSACVRLTNPWYCLLISHICQVFYDTFRRALRASLASASRVGCAIICRVGRLAHLSFKRRWVPTLIETAPFLIRPEGPSCRIRFMLFKKLNRFINRIIWTVTYFYPCYVFECPSFYDGCYPLKLGQPPALGQEWHLEAGAGGSLTTAAKLENCFSVFFSPHSGHAGALADADGTSTSFTNPHCVHLYSKIGIENPKTK